MRTVRVGVRDGTETLSRIAIADAGSAAGPYCDPSWLWTPPLHQPYCRLHFLKECSMYHLQENERFKRMVGTCMPKFDKTRKWLATPTRVQPARRAREKTSKGPSSVLVGSRNPSPARGDKVDHVSTTIRTLHQQLHLHLPWPIYKTKIEAEINRHSGKIIQSNQHKDKNNLSFECRYCKFYPEVIDCQGSVSRRLAPPAPMHFIQLSDMSNAQAVEFGGLKFVVDVSDGHETIVLLAMDKLGDLTSYQENVGRVDELGLVRDDRPRKRSATIEPIELGEPASEIPKKRRRKGE
ncbi:hypothetical protein F4805DRAFT_478613 [Annulohypoxylon moriforme]|nr:hypothetical protein F4805DRAFT_478613 [Annulohypoxylon moriforme]